MSVGSVTISALTERGSTKPLYQTSSYCGSTYSGTGVGVGVGSGVGVGVGVGVGEGVAVGATDVAVVGTSVVSLESKKEQPTSEQATRDIAKKLVIAELIFIEFM